jgi:hypothetical protein
MKKLTLIFLLPLLLASCGSVLQAPTSTPTPTRAKPTRTPLPLPTTTATPPVVLDSLLEGAVVDYTDGFEGSKKIDWPIDDAASTSISGGVLEVNGNDWKGAAWAGTMTQNEAVTIRFKYKQGTIFEAYIQTGTWGKKDARRFGLYVMDKTVRTDVWQGAVHTIDRRVTGTLTLRADRWYELLLIVEPKGAFTAIINDPDEAEGTIRYREELGENWVGLTWFFKVGADRGSVTFDDFAKLSFTKVK